MDSQHQASMSKQQEIKPKEGLHVLHLYYSIDWVLWRGFDSPHRERLLSEFADLLDLLRVTELTQVLTQAVVSPKADLGLMLLTPDLTDLVRMEKRFSASLGGVLSPQFSYFSMTERSEYFPTREEHIERVLIAERGLKQGSPEFEEALASFDEHMDRYVRRRVWPVLPQWPVICFYPMSKRRGEAQNWYRLDFAERGKLMAAHGVTGRQYAGRILQLITGSTGLDEMEWGVTLLSHNVEDIKDIVYTMRFDPVSAEYAEFGEFFIGLQLPLEELWETLGLD